MGDSDGAWGILAQHDDELAGVFDSYDRLPEGGSNPALDAFLDRKHLSIGALVRVGARLAEHDVLAFAFPGGIKYRDMVTDRRWSWMGSTWRELKIVRSGRERARVAIVAEGETDGARLVMLYPDADVAVLPAGADPRPHTEAYGEQLGAYELVLLAQDADAAGDTGAALMSEHLTGKTMRWPAPGGDDWSAVALDAEVPPLPSPDDVQVPVSQRLLVSARDLMAIEPPEIESYYEQALLPVGGQLILHGSMKSMKSYLSFDLAAALAQSTSWAGFEPTDEPIKTAIMQFEIPWAYYRLRIAAMLEAAPQRDLLLENLLTWTPMNRPRFVAGNTKSEDAVLRELDDHGVLAFVLDPIRRATGAVDLNAEKDVRPVLNFFERVQNLGITVITTHHDNKQYARGGGGDPLGMTGSGAFGGDADSIVSVAIPRGHEITSPNRNLHFLLRNAPSPGPRSMRLTDAGSIEYTLTPVGEDAGEHPTPGSDAPAI